MRCVRVWFKKMGMSRYVSHLDLMRAMTRAVRRARVPLWYTEGFNPHPYITFALPLSLGMESLYESMDMRIEGECTNEEIYEMMKGAMPPGIEITAVKDPVYDPKKISFGEFDIFFDCEKDADGLIKMIEEMLSGDELIVQKLGKKGRHKVLKDINLIEFIKHYKIGKLDNRVKLSVTLPAGSTTNVNPSLLADEVQKRADGVSYSLVRKKLLIEDMTDFE
ncbi:MAG: TIGR03936 family radical SAM-associated protein [Acutalibacteraceae bacterium]|nr:TIGR03936 family radical SAM-associated protein [Acutalibacteraceae bacterium]